jgi:hypothetical protein
MTMTAKSLKTPPPPPEPLDFSGATDTEKKEVAALVREFLNGFEADYRQKIDERADKSN